MQARSIPVEPLQAEPFIRKFGQWFATFSLAFSVIWVSFKDGGAHRPTLIKAQLLVFAALIILAVTKGLVFPKNRGTLITVGVVVLAASVSTVTSLDLDASFPALLNWLWLGGVALLAPAVLQDARRYELMIAALLGAALIQVAYSFWIWQGIGVAGRLQSGTFHSPNQYAGYLILLVPLFLAAALTESGVIRKVGWGLLAVLVYLGIALSGSRAGAVAAVIGVSIAVGICARRRPGRTFASLGVIAIGFVGAGWLMTGPVFFPEAQGEGSTGALTTFKSKSGSGPRSSFERIEWSKAAFRVGASRPLTGAGLGTFPDMIFEFQDETVPWSRYAHNDYFEAFADGGLPLAIGLIALPITALWAARRRLSGWRIGLAAGLVGASAHLLVDHDWSYPGYSVTYTVMAMMLAVDPIDAPRITTKSFRAPLIIVAGALIALLLNGSMPFATKPQLRKAEELIALGGVQNLRRAEQILVQAMSTDQLDLPLTWQLAAVKNKLGLVDQARRLHEAAINRAPNAMGVYVEAAQFELSANRPDAALKLADRGIALIRGRVDSDRLRGALSELLSVRTSVRDQLGA